MTDVTPGMFTTAPSRASSVESVKSVRTRSSAVEPARAEGETVMASSPITAWIEDDASGLWVVAVWAAWVLVLLLVCGGLYALTVPVALGALGAEGMQVPLGRAIVKTTMLMVLYMSFYGWMEFQAIRQLRTGAESK